jgi:hypothetical protein
MALWLRMIVSALLEREPEEAFKYVQNAASFARENQVRPFLLQVDFISPFPVDRETRC